MMYAPPSMPHPLQEEHYAAQKTREEQQRAAKLVLRETLNRSLEDKLAAARRKEEQERAEEEERRIFAEAKRVSADRQTDRQTDRQMSCKLNSACFILSKRMNRLRKEKEAELFQQFQHQQQYMCSQLKTRQDQQQSNEDELIAKAVAEQEKKREVSQDIVSVPPTLVCQRAFLID